MECCKSSGVWHLPLANEEPEEFLTNFMLPPKNWITLRFKK